MKQYIVNISDGRCDDWYFADEEDMSEYAKYGNYASIYLIDKELSEEEKKKLLED